MTQSSVARRYAKALLSLALESGAAEGTGEELEKALAAIEASSEARALLLLPGISASRRLSAVDAVAQALELSPLTRDFLRLLAERHRSPGLADIARSFRDLLDHQVGRVRATVTAAVPLEPGDVSRLQKALAAATSKTVVLEQRTDPAILGGAVAQVGPVQYDGSLRTQLERLREKLKSAPLS